MSVVLYRKGNTHKVTVEGVTYECEMQKFPSDNWKGMLTHGWFQHPKDIDPPKSKPVIKKKINPVRPAERAVENTVKPVEKIEDFTPVKEFYETEPKKKEYEPVWPTYTKKKRKGRTKGSKNRKKK